MLAGLKNEDPLVSMGSLAGLCSSEAGVPCYKPRPGLASRLYYLVSSSIFAIVFGVLAGSPKGQAKPKPPEVRSCRHRRHRTADATLHNTELTQRCVLRYTQRCQAQAAQKTDTKAESMFKL